MRWFLSLASVLCGALVFDASGQGVGINSTGASPDSSAILDVASTTKGVLLPRMTSMERQAIPSPAKGLLVYQTDDDSWWYHDGLTWRPFLGKEWLSYTVNGF